VFGSIPVRAVASGQNAVLEPTHQIVRIEDATGAMIPLRGLHQGTFERVRAAGPTAVEVHGPTSMQLVDISQPEAPVVKAGGLLTPVNVEWLRYEVSERAPRLLTVPTSLAKTTGPVTTLYWENPNALPTVAGSIANDDPTGEWRTSAQFLYQLSPTDGPTIRLRRFPAGGVTRAPRQTLAADVDQVLTQPVPAGLGKRANIWFEADSSNLVILEQRAGGAGVVSTTIVNWFGRSQGGYEWIFTGPPTSSIPVSMGLAKGRAVLVFNDQIATATKDGVGSAAKFEARDVTLDGLLAMNEDFVYLGVSFHSGAETKGALVLRAQDLSEVARYTTAEGVLSMAEVGANLVFGMRSTLTVASPACPVR